MGKNIPFPHQNFITIHPLKKAKTTFYFEFDDFLKRKSIMTDTVIVEKQQ